MGGFRHRNQACDSAWLTDLQDDWNQYLGRVHGSVHAEPECWRGAVRWALWATPLWQSQLWSTRGGNGERVSEESHESGIYEKTG